MGDGRAAQTGFVGKYAAGKTIAHGQHNAIPGCAPCCSAEIEGFFKNQRKGSRYFGDIEQQSNNGDQYIEHGHERNQLFIDSGNPANSA